MIARDLVMTVRPGTVEMRLAESDDSEFFVELSKREAPVVFDDVPLLVEVRGPQIDGERAIDRFVVRTDNGGIASFIVPAPDASGTTTITVQPAWLDTAVQRWYDAIEGQATLDLLDAAVARVRDRAILEVSSSAAEIPTAVVIIDRDIAGNPIESTDTMRGVIQGFAETGFRIRQVDLSAAQRESLAAIDRLTVSDLYDILPFEVLSQVDRVIVGEVNISDFRESEGFSVTVGVSASAFDLRRDQVLARTSFEERTNGSDSRSAIRAAFQAAGRRLSRRIVPRLP